MASLYDRGDQVRLSGRWDNAAGTPVDPTTVKLKYLAPSGAVVILTYGVDAAVVKDSTGRYHTDLLLGESGLWQYRWEGSGVANPGVYESSFVVRRTELA